MTSMTQTSGEVARELLISGLPVTERKLNVNGVSTAVLEGGDGPPIVLLQAEFGAVWMQVIPELVLTHRVITPDLPGLGASEVSHGRIDPRGVLAWLDEFIDRTCAESASAGWQGTGGCPRGSLRRGAWQTALTDSCSWTPTAWAGSDHPCG